MSLLKDYDLKRGAIRIDDIPVDECVTGKVLAG